MLRVPPVDDLPRLMRKLSVELERDQASDEMVQVVLLGLLDQERTRAKRRGQATRNTSEEEVVKRAEALMERLMTLRR